MVKPRKGTNYTSFSSSSNKSSLNVNKSGSIASNKSYGHNNSNNIKKEPTIELKEKKDYDDDYNSGFGQYLRSAEGSQMMIMFVLANSAVIFLTMAWPNFKEIFRSIRDAFFE